MVALVPLIWGLSFLTAGVGFIISKFKPTPETVGLAGIPIFGWVIIVILILILLRKK